MVTGKSSEALRDPSLSLRISAQGSRLEYASTWMALGGLVYPQPAATSACPGWFLPGRAGTRTAIWRQKICSVSETGCNEIDWTCLDLQGLSEERLRILLRGVNSMDKPNGRLVLVSYTHHCASTSSLSTRWSSWALQGDLILGRASRLYAFSGYHNRTSLPSRALGRTTGTQEVRPSRSSRTKDSPPQISYAHSR